MTFQDYNVHLLSFFSLLFFHFSSCDGFFANQFFESLLRLNFSDIPCVFTFYVSRLTTLTSHNLGLYYKKNYKKIINLLKIKTDFLSLTFLLLTSFSQHISLSSISFLLGSLLRVIIMRMRVIMSLFKNVRAHLTNPQIETKI